MWMNHSDVDEAVHRFRTHPVLGPATRVLRDFVREVDAHSDGWPYWKAPSHAAKQLMTLIHGHLRAGMGAYPELPQPTPEDIRRSLAPIKAFMTRKGAQAGMAPLRLDELA
jgi:hypothetical protein